MELINFEIKRNNLFKKIARLFVPGALFSYSQFGEDIILEYLFSQLKIDNPTYLDLGANDPRIGSNTYFFYKKGSSGVLIEPNPILYKKLKKVRPRDTILNVGVGFDNELKEADYFEFPDWCNGLNTFSRENALYWQTVGHPDHGKLSYKNVIPIKLITTDKILNEYFKGRSPNLISLDIEGMDLQILENIDFGICRSEVICVETLGYDSEKKTYKRKDIISFLESKSYSVFADTRVNTIFCKSDLIQR